MSARNRLVCVLLGIAALASGVVASCGSSSDSAVVVHVQGPATLPAIYRFHAILSNDETSDSKLFPQSLPATAVAIAMPTAFSITLPRARTGELDIALDALGATGDILANGAGTATINVGGTAEVTITLAAGISLCGNGLIDAGEQCDDGDRITNGTCDFRCQKHTPIRGKDGGPSDGDGVGTGGNGTGGKGGAGGVIGAGGAGIGGKIGTGGIGAGGAGAGGIIGTGGNGIGGAGIGGSGVGGAGGNGGCAIELLNNGTFDAGPLGWTVTSPINTQMIYMSGNAALGGITASSPYYTALMGRNLAVPAGSTGMVQETLAQAITVPAAASTITVQGFVQSAALTAIACPTCNTAVIEIVHSPDVVNVKSWTPANGMGSWVAFGTTIDATPFRGTNVLFQLRATATSNTVVAFYFDSLSAKVDRCGP
jgi:cysteine-rich repeat protein